MPAAPGAAEALGKALVVENRAAASTPRIVDVARRAAKAAQEGNYRQGLEGIRSPNMDSQKAQEKIEQIGKRNRATGKRERPAGTPEAGRYARAEEIRILAEEFGQKGYDSMTDPQKKSLREMVLKEAMRVPVIADQLRQINAGMPANPNDPDLRAYAERLLRDPSIVQKAREGHVAVSENQSLLVGNGEDLAEDEFEVAKIAEKSAKEALDEATRRKALVDTQMKMFEIDKATGLPALGAKSAERIRELKNKGDLNKNHEQYSHEVEDLVKRRDVLLHVQASVGIQPESTTVTAKGVSTTTQGRSIDKINEDLEALQEQLNIARENAAKAQAEIDELQRLEAREKELIEDQTRLKSDEEAKDLAHKTAQIETAKRTRQLGDAIKLRQSQEEDIARAFEGILPKAVTELLGDQITDVAAKVDDEMVKAADEAKTADQKAIYTLMDATWNREVSGIRRLWKGRREINSDVVVSDYSLLLKGGPEAVVRKLLGSRYVGPGASADLDSLLKDGSLVEAVGKDVVKNLLAKKFLSSGIDSVDVDIIGSSQWGEGMIEAAIAHKDVLAGNLAKLQEAGLLDRGGIMQRLRKNPSWLLLLLGLAGVGGLAFGPGGALIGSAIGAEYARRNESSNPLVDLAA